MRPRNCGNVELSGSPHELFHSSEAAFVPARCTCIMPRHSVLHARSPSRNRAPNVPKPTALQPLALT